MKLNPNYKNKEICPNTLDHLRCWLYCKENDISFEQKFTEIIHEQEAEMYVDTKNVDNTQIQLSKQLISEQLLQGGLSENEVADIFNIIDESYSTGIYSFKKEMYIIISIKNIILMILLVLIKT